MKEIKKVLLDSVILIDLRYEKLVKQSKRNYKVYNESLPVDTNDKMIGLHISLEMKFEDMDKECQSLHLRIRQIGMVVGVFVNEI